MSKCPTEVSNGARNKDKAFQSASQGAEDDKSLAVCMDKK